MSHSNSEGATPSPVNLEPFHLRFIRSIRTATTPGDLPPKDDDREKFLVFYRRVYMKVSETKYLLYDGPQPPHAGDLIVIDGKLIYLNASGIYRVDDKDIPFETTVQFEVPKPVDVATRATDLPADAENLPEASNTSCPHPQRSSVRSFNRATDISGSRANIPDDFMPEGLAPAPALREHPRLRLAPQAGRYSQETGESHALTATPGRYQRVVRSPSGQHRVVGTSSQRNQVLLIHPLLSVIFCLSVYSVVISFFGILGIFRFLST